MKKYGQKAELQQALWKKLYKLCKNCNTDDGSKDWNATLGKDSAINTTHMIKNMGYTFFHFFHQPEIADKQKKKCADFIADKLSPSKVTEFLKLFLSYKRGTSKKAKFSGNFSRPIRAFFNPSGRKNALIGRELPRECCFYPSVYHSCKFLV